MSSSGASSSGTSPQRPLEPFEDAQIWGPRVTDAMAAMDTPNTRAAAANARASRSTRSQSSASEAASEPESFTFDDLRPGERLSQTGISLQAYILGIALGAGAAFTLQYALFEPKHIWRPFFFPGVLSLFHFCEFYTYARWNLKNTTLDSYLTFSNGPAYTSAMTFAWLETIVTSIWFPEWQSRWAKPWIQVIGAVLLVGGQLVRHTSIATAGTSFNHHVQHKRRTDHVLITWGPYSWTRHPSYFGFYWWAIGTQLLLGNAVSTPIFAIVLWRFFFRRIPVEERALLKFFGDDYVQYRKGTRIGIPFMGFASESALKRMNAVPR